MSTQQQDQSHSTEPSQVSGNLKIAQGTAYEAVGSLLPGETGEAWAASGQQLKQAGETEVANAQQREAVDATIDSGAAKIKSAWGYVTGDQQKQTDGNLEAEKAQWAYKRATDGITAVPVPSAEGVKGKLESVVGMVTGDQEKQKEGNMRAEKAAWKDGV
ncbi:hypothetical protein Q5752_003278 [Cryptotrichosporon argae]